MRRRGQGQEGASLMELMFTMAIGAVVLVSISRFILKARGSMSREEATSELIASNRRVQDNLRAGLNAADLLLLRYPTTDCSALRTAIINSISATAGSPLPVTFSGMAEAIDDSKVDLSGGSGASWGNELFYVASLPPVTFTVSVSGTATSAGPVLLAPTDLSWYAHTYNVSVDRIQFVAVYLSQQTGKNLKGGVKPLRLVEWRSKPYATLDLGSNWRGDWVPGAVLTGTCQALLGAGYAVVVDSNPGNVLNTTVGASGGYYSISGNAAFTNVAIPANLGRSSWAYLDEFTLSQTFGISAIRDQGQVSRLKTGKGYAGSAGYSVAYNTLSPTVNSTLKVTKLLGVAENGSALKVPAYAQADLNSMAGFPGGFEVGVVGRPKSREVFIRLVQMAGSADVLAVRQGAKDFLGVESENYITVNNLY